VLAAGQIVKSGGRDLAIRLEQEGYAPILREAGMEPTEVDATPEPAEPDTEH
jgi:hypothetical protein